MTTIIGVKALKTQEKIFIEEITTQVVISITPVTLSQQHIFLHIIDHGWCRDASHDHDSFQMDPNGVFDLILLPFQK